MAHSRAAQAEVMLLHCAELKREVARGSPPHFCQPSLRRDSPSHK